MDIKQLREKVKRYILSVKNTQRYEGVYYSAFAQGYLAGRLYSLEEVAKWLEEVE